MTDVDTHPCIVERQADTLAYVTQYLIRCRCHMDSWQVWRAGDAPVTCPVSGTDLTPATSDERT